MNTLFFIILIITGVINVLFVYRMSIKYQFLNDADMKHAETYANLSNKTSIKDILNNIYNKINDTSNDGKFYIDVDNPVDMNHEHYKEMTHGIVSHLRHNGYRVDISTNVDNSLKFIIKW